MKKIKRFIVFLLLYLFVPHYCFSQVSTPNKQFENVHEVKIRSEVLNEDRTLYIFEPKGIKEKLPVLYILDGEMIPLFQEALIATNTNPHIIVGIRTVENRNRDMIPVKTNSRRGSGGGPLFLQFIINELQPYIDNNYSTNKQNVLYGGSNAGLFVIYALLTSPQNFKGFISNSTTIGHCQDYMIQLLNEFNSKEQLRGKYLYVYYGTLDPSTRVLGFIENYNNMLIDQLGEYLNIEIKALKDQSHVPPGGIIEGLKFVYNL